jgi:hypothetical protein
MSWLGKIKAAKVEMAAPNVDPWQLPLARVHGKIDYDGLERVSSQTLMDMLEVPQRSRRAGTYRHLSKLMVELGGAQCVCAPGREATIWNRSAATAAMPGAVPTCLIENVRPSAAMRQFNSADQR